MPELSDEECLAILQAKPRDGLAADRAYQTLVERHSGRLDRALRCGCPWLNEQDREDVRQEAWLVVLRRLDDNIRPGAFCAWLRTVATNHAIDRARRRRPETLGTHEPVTTQPGILHALTIKEQMRHCVERLKPEHRDYLARLFNMETPDQIAHALGRRVERIHQIKHEVKTLLYGCMELEL
jgi:RNA polymerase sigma factor (sigma-70 family)